LAQALILFYNKAWGQRPELPSDTPTGVEFTTDARRYAEADAIVFHVPQLTYGRRLLMPRKRRGQLWVAHTIECEENYVMLRDPKFMRHFDLTMTYRLDSDVPATYVTYYAGAENLARALRRPPQPKISEPLVNSFVSSRINRSGRREYLRELARYLPMDSYGTFMRNRTLALDLGRPSKLETIARYKFTLSFENACGRDYVTEKFFDPLVAGSVPVYLGAPNVEDFAPGDRCFINLADFPNPKHLAQYLKELAADADAYQSYFAWKEQPYRPAFRNLLGLTAAGPIARLCDVVHARLNPDQSLA
jgi:hypothetical protein